MRIKTVHVEPSSTSARPVNFILSTLLTSLLCVGFSLMLTSTYTLTVDLRIFIPGIVVMAFLATCFHILTEKRKWISVVLLLISFLIPVGAVIFGIAGIREGMDSLMFMLKKFTFRDLPFDYEEAVDARTVLTRFLLVVNLLPVLFTTYVITRRKSILLCVPFYIPFLFFSVALNYMFPKQIWCELALAGILMLCFFQSLRKGDRVKSDRRLLVLSIPALLLSFLVGMWFPQKTYDKQSLAVRQMNSIKNLLGNDTLHNSLPANVQKLLDDVEKSYLGGTMLEDIGGSVVTSATTSEDLNAVGNFDPPYFVVLTMKRTVNPSMRGISGSKYLYLRTTSMDTYTGHKWKISEDEPDADEIYAEGAKIPREGAPYVLDLKFTYEPEFTYSPLYTDGYVVSASAGIPESTDYNVRCLLEESGGDGVTYALSELPVRRESTCWSEEYIDYVNTTSLEVPQETVDAILGTGVLPEWFMSVYEGKTEMSTIDKVLAVTDYVSSLHSYDEHTDYPPSDQDFVSWFLKDSRTGFCVHYASTAVVLLRMLGVPARYCSGYMVNTAVDGRDCEVASTDAHAWFEVFLPEYGWVMGDPTPGNSKAASRFDVSGLVKKYDLPSIFAPSDDTDPSDPSDPSATDPLTGLLQPTDPSSDPSVPGTNGDPSSTTTGFGNSGTSPVSPDGNGGGTLDPSSPATATGKKSTPKWLKALGKAILPILIVLLVLLLIRTAYSFIWTRAFHQKDINASARAYYRYFQWVGKKWKGRPATKARMLALKATFSEDGITEKELDDLILFGKQGLANTRKKQPWYKRVPVRLLFEVRI
ncbi:MAG: transglutaminase domain-containing protein [Clostridiales bacterium]|nr:transglutaminase domain-containing protein [Clostridiales bacterium]